MAKKSYMVRVPATMSVHVEAENQMEAEKLATDEFASFLRFLEKGGDIGVGSSLEKFEVECLDGNEDNGYTLPLRLVKSDTTRFEKIVSYTLDIGGGRTLTMCSKQLQDSVLDDYESEIEPENDADAKLYESLSEDEQEEVREFIGEIE